MFCSVILLPLTLVQRRWPEDAIVLLGLEHGRLLDGHLVRVGVDLPHGVVVGGLGVPPLLPYALLLYITELIYKCTTDFGP